MILHAAFGAFFLHFGFRRISTWRAVRVANPVFHDHIAFVADDIVRSAGEPDSISQGSTPLTGYGGCFYRLISIEMH